MKLQDIFHIGNSGQTECGTDSDEGFVEIAGKAADIVSVNIKDGKYDKIVKKLESFSESGKNRERYVFEAPSITGWVTAFLICVLFSIVFAYFFVISAGILIYSSSFSIYGVCGMITAFAVIAANILMVGKSVKEIRFSRRYDHYQNVLRYRSIEIVDDLADMIKADRIVVEKDLAKAVKLKLIPQGHFGRGNVIFMVSDAVFNEYSERRAVYDRYFRKLMEERGRMKERSRETEELLEQGQEYIEKIRDSNDIIKDKEISRKLDRMERIVSAIFHEVDVNPSQANKLGVFMGYYIPATEKILEAYIELDEKQVKGRSTEKTQTCK